MRTLIIVSLFAATTMTSAFSAPAMAGNFTSKAAFEADCAARHAKIIPDGHGGFHCPSSGPAVSNHHDHNGPVIMASSGYPDTDNFRAFKADCDSRGGKIYTAAEWNAMTGAHLAPNDFHCHAGDTWSQDH